jgi:hypothetical protein
VGPFFTARESQGSGGTVGPFFTARESQGSGGTVGPFFTARESQGSGGTVGPLLTANRVARGLALRARAIAKNAQAAPETKRFSNNLRMLNKLLFQI